MTLTEPFPWNAPTPPSSVSIEEFKAELTKLRIEKRWILMSPDGRVWSGTQPEIAREALRSLDLTELLAAKEVKK